MRRLGLLDGRRMDVRGVQDEALRFLHHVDDVLAATSCCVEIANRIQIFVCLADRVLGVARVAVVLRRILVKWGFENVSVVLAMRCVILADEAVVCELLFAA